MLFTTAIRAARPALARAARPTSSATRALSVSAVRCSGPAPPSLLGPGSKAGEVPSDETQATGLERLQLLGEMQGVPAFDYEPLDSSRVGTLEDPIKVFSLDVERVVGCTGSPADSHEVHWFKVKKDKTRRCPECGSAYALDFQGDEHLLAHGH
ncbi:COX5B-domain-containing protein [Coniophora puteana RWD-64-598 SS2]|uniref:COX5B-domain-containing protein n=1 Tax=Coniophora puteana (strain RWD-64-598) TaxID=741705 RepID=A0A5M3MYZ8_CONPW|nr:COX5B-domain-containing protein [Coniophora puteana RWD-64-598 SS2]EIW84383.1 COX5B-domain-containing protein [Coniophora puteana RWD-64-598 SS2]